MPGESFIVGLALGVLAAAIVAVVYLFRSKP